MEPESSTMDDTGPWADSAEVKTSTFALQLFFSVLVIFKYLEKTRWRFFLITIDVLKWCDDKLYNFRINQNEWRREEDAEQGDAERRVGSGFAHLVICLFVMFNIILYSCRVFMLVPKICVELPVSWFMAIGITFVFWPIIDGVLDRITWICRKLLHGITWIICRQMLRRPYKNSDE